VNKTRERARLLKAFHKTGDEDFLRAAEALQIPLMDHLQQLRKYPGSRGKGSAGKEARSRLYRMHRSVVAGASVLAAARQEVAEHGRGAHASREAAIDYLRSRYQAEAESIAAVMTAADRLRDRWWALERHCASIANLRQAAQISLPLHEPTRAAQWFERFGSLVHLIRHQIISWRNTRPKSAEKRSNDMSASM
jgi:hypothetical protein